MVNKFENFKYIILSSLLLFYSCDYLVPDPANGLIRIDSNSEFNFEVNSIRTQNGHILNSEYYYSGAQFLEKNDNAPSWIINEYDLENGSAVYDSHGKMLLDIYKLETPFTIYKTANSNILFLVKYNDTLQFIMYD